MPPEMEAVNQQMLMLQKQIQALQDSIDSPPANINLPSLPRAQPPVEVCESVAMSELSVVYHSPSSGSDSSGSSGSTKTPPSRHPDMMSKEDVMVYLKVQSMIDEQQKRQVAQPAAEATTKTTDVKPELGVNQLDKVQKRKLNTKTRADARSPMLPHSDAERYNFVQVLEQMFNGEEWLDNHGVAVTEHSSTTDEIADLSAAMFSTLMPSEKDSNKGSNALIQELGDALPKGQGVELWHDIVDLVMPDTPLAMLDLLPHYNDLVQLPGESMEAWTLRHRIAHRIMKRCCDRQQIPFDDLDSVRTLVDFIKGIKEGAHSSLLEAELKKLYTGEITVQGTTIKEFSNLCKMSLNAKKITFKPVTVHFGSTIKKPPPKPPPEYGKARTAGGPGNKDATTKDTVVAGGGQAPKLQDFESIYEAMLAYANKQGGSITDSESEDLISKFGCPMHWIPRKRHGEDGWHTLLNCKICGDKYIVTDNPDWVSKRTDAKPKARQTTTSGSDATNSEGTPAPWTTVSRRTRSYVSHSSISLPSLPIKVENQYGVLADDGDTEDEQEIDVNKNDSDQCTEQSSTSKSSVAPNRSHDISSAARPSAAPSILRTDPVPPSSHSIKWAIPPALTQGGKLLSHVKRVRNHLVRLACSGRARAVSIINLLCADSGATEHMCPFKEYFVEYTPLTNTYILTADNTPLEVCGRGIIQIKVCGYVLRLINVLHVPELSMPLFSTGTHRKGGDGCFFLQDHRGCTLGFPTFTVDIDDQNDCSIEFQGATEATRVDFDEANPHKRHSPDGLALHCDAPRIPPSFFQHLARPVRTRGQAKAELKAIKDAADAHAHRRGEDDGESDDAPTKFPLAEEGKDDAVFDDVSTVHTNDDITVNTELQNWDDDDEWEADDEHDVHVNWGKTGGNPSPERDVIWGLENIWEMEKSPSKCDPVNQFDNLDNDSVGASISQRFDDIRIDGRKLESKRVVEIPSMYTPDATAAAEVHLTDHELHHAFGNRQFSKYEDFGEVMDNVKVRNLSEDPAKIRSTGDFVNIKRTRRKGKVNHPDQPGHTIAFDIGYGTGISPGGHRYCITFIDKMSKNKWFYGLRDLKGETLLDAFWLLYVDAGGFPKRFECDHDPKFLGTKVRTLLKRRGIKLRMSPPDRQSQNGLVERHWATAYAMARSYLAEAQLPKRLWFWAIREAMIRSNLIPVTLEYNGTKRLTTSHELYYGEKPDGRILYPFGCLAFFKKSRDSVAAGISADGKQHVHHRTKSESQTLPGVAIGRSAVTNAMMFWNPETSRIYTSTDYKLDEGRSSRSMFPDLIYDGGLELRLCQEGSHQSLPFTIGSTVLFGLEYEDGADATPKDLTQAIAVGQGTIVGLPINRSDVESFYTVALDDGSTLPLHESEIWAPDDAIGGAEFYDPTQGNYEEDQPRTPIWMQPEAETKVMLEHDGERHLGYLRQDAGGWCFQQDAIDDEDDEDNENDTKVIVMNIPLPNLLLNWKDRLIEGTLEIGWGEHDSDERHYLEQIIGSGRHVSARNLQSPCPGFLGKAMRDPSHPDYQTWLDSYKEEFDGLNRMGTYRIIKWAEVKKLGVMPIPTMNVLSVKPDATGAPLRAKSRTVVLGNQEQRCWEKNDVYAPVVAKAGARALVAYGVHKGRVVKQLDAKNAFCQPEIPKDETVVVTPPKGCPFSEPGDYWLLLKTLYGLRRSPRHWFKLFSGKLIELGFKPCGNEPCLFVGTAPNGGKVYLAAYVDDGIYFGENDEAEAWFESKLKDMISVDFMGPVSWYLGVYYEWGRTSDGRLTVHLSQEAMVNKILEQEKLVDSTPVGSPYRSGLPIDRIPKDGRPAEEKPALVKRYQSIVGSLIWLSSQTRPDISTSVSLLAAHLHNPSDGHLDAARHVTKYLKGSAQWGLRYTQPSNAKRHRDLDLSRLRGEVAWPDDVVGKPEASEYPFGTHTDANWGPQDASTPKPGEMRSQNEVNSILGAVVFLCGGPLDWQAIREKRPSGSSCEAEVKAMCTGTKMLRYIRIIFRDLGATELLDDVPLLFNDNQGSVTWANSEAMTKKMRHVDIQEAIVRSAIQEEEVTVGHIPGRLNTSDIFTKEMKDTKHFQALRASLMSPRYIN